MNIIKCFLFNHFLEARADTDNVFVHSLEELKTRKKDLLRFTDLYVHWLYPLFYHSHRFCMKVSSSSNLSGTVLKCTQCFETNFWCKLILFGSLPQMFWRHCCSSWFLKKFLRELLLEQIQNNETICEYLQENKKPPLSLCFFKGNNSDKLG